MVHTRSSRRSSLVLNDGVSCEEKLRNGCYSDPIGQPKLKRLKVPSVSELSPDFGSISMRLRSRTKEKEEVTLETCNNMSVSDDCVLSSEADIELILGRNVGERDQLKSVDEKLCNGVEVGVTTGAESHRVTTAEDTSELNGVVGNVRRQSIIGTKHLRGRMVSIVGHLPPNMGSKLPKSGKTVKVVSVSVEEEKLVVEKSGPGDHLGQSLAKSISPEVLKPLELEKSKATVPKPNEATGRRITRSAVAIHSPLKLSTEMNGEHNEGSRRSEKVILNKESLAKKSRLSDEGIPPSHPTGPNSKDSARYKVKEALRLFHETCRKIMLEEEASPRERNDSNFRVDVEASKLLKSKGISFSTGAQIMGSVPGVEVGDEFQYRMELNFLGIHRLNRDGIDYMKDDSKKLVATSIVVSEGYDDELDNSDVLIYTGQGENIMKRKRKGKKCNEPKDQQLVKGNLALANSKLIKNPVRVIKGNTKTSLESSTDDKNYVYDGLYLVEDFWKEIGSHGKLVFKFRLRRIPGQPELSWKVLKKSKKSKLRESLCNVDISEGKERLPICAVNGIDDEKPPLFNYTAKMIYPDWCRPIPPKGCGCTKRCSESKKCSCIAKNGGDLPYNDEGAIIRAKPLVYECGPLCNCPPACYLRVTQRGIKFQLEIFKTESRGWGVRSRNLIPSGSFICEYTGELIEEKEAERLAGKDEYLFDIGKDHETSGFTIDAARKGNIGRFINHSCSPNLYAQDVLYDYEEKRIPHVMFFAMDDIPPLEELSYDYNYVIDQVRDANGNIRKKYCYCGSSECTGRLY